METTSLLASLALASCLTAAPTVDLAGKWRFVLNPKDEIIGAKPEDWKFADTIHLPGTVTSQSFGEAPSIKP